MKKQKEIEYRKSENVQVAKRFRVVLKGMDLGYTVLKT